VNPALLLEFRTRFTLPDGSRRASTRTISL
jgi:hypothetical protein